MSNSVDTHIKSHAFEGALIQQRIDDGYLNATALCKAAGKLFGHYKALDSTQAFLGVLSNDIGIPISTLVVSKRGNSRAFAQGTWVHPQVAMHLAQWLSPEFAVFVTKVLVDWFRGDGTRPARGDGRAAASARSPHYVNPTLLAHFTCNLRTACDAAEHLGAPLDASAAWSWVIQRGDALAEMPPRWRMRVFADAAGLSKKDRLAIEAALREGSDHDQ